MATGSRRTSVGSRGGFLSFVVVCLCFADVAYVARGAAEEKKDDCPCDGNAPAQGSTTGSPGSPFTQKSAPQAPPPFVFDPPSMRVNAEIGLGFKTFYLVNEVVSALKNKTQSLLSKPALREYRKQSNARISAVAAHWFRALMAMLTGEVQLKEHPGALVRTELNPSKLRDLEDEFLVIVLTAWGLVGPSSRDATCDAGTAACRSQLEDVLYTALTLFWTEILSPHPPGSLHFNFREIVSGSACPFFMLTDRDFLAAKFSGDVQSLSGVARILQKLQERRYTSSRCLLFKDHLLPEIDRVGVTLREQVSKIRNEMADKSNYSLRDHLKAMEAKAAEEETAHKAKLLDNMKLVDQSAARNSADCTRPCSALAADILKAKGAVGPLNLREFVVSQLDERLENGQLCCTVKELIQAVKKKHTGAATEPRSSCSCPK
ncbi:transmembrane protein [Cystoisospora suis]|uniref:Transmembrane protein n=1 Tax=Cystoisospora suis TaxID=483139 RepID=A0A2C6L4P4_9APIC|nr:transmembrane protein [Cystoisospora suis]